MSWQAPFLGDLRPWIGLVITGVGGYYGLETRLALVTQTQGNLVPVERMAVAEGRLSQLEARDSISDGALSEFKQDMNNRMGRIEGKIDRLLENRQK